MPEKTTRRPARRVVLASTSRYRRELLSRLGLAFEVAAPGVVETALPREAPAATAQRLALAKAQAVADRFPDALIVGSDQIADLDGIPIGKPGDHRGAVEQLTLLSGRAVVFHTALALLDAASGTARTALIDVVSSFCVLTPQVIQDYLEREQPYDCAGSVRAEGLGIALFERIESPDPTALIGLPLIALARLLREAGVEVVAPASGAHEAARGR
jgi:7-methyl-GTP pyrophosphatase